MLERVIWADVTGICGFWDGSCRTAGCGPGMWVSVFTPPLGWFAVKKHVSQCLVEILWMLKSGAAR